MVYAPAGVLAGRVYVALAFPFETARDVTDDPTGVAPLSRVNLTPPPSTMPPALLTLATSVKAWVLGLVIAHVSETVIVVAGDPLPTKATCCGEFPASSVKESTAVRAPDAEGWKLIETAQFRPGGTGEPQVFTAEKSDAFPPEIASLLMLRGDRPVFITVTEMGALDTPIA